MRNTIYLLCFIMAIGCSKNDTDLKKIKSVKIGMSIDSCVHLLGNPYRIGNNIGTHSLWCKANSRNLNYVLNKTDNVNTIKNKVIDYDKNIKFCCSGFEEDFIKRNGDFFLEFNYSKKIMGKSKLWIHINKNFDVSLVYLKEYNLLDDNTKYCLGY